MELTPFKGGASASPEDESPFLTPQGLIIKDFFERCSHARVAEILNRYGAESGAAFIEMRVSAFHSERENFMSQGESLESATNKALEKLLEGLTDNDEGEDGIAREEVVAL
ncbi:MAG: hypothetical protein IM613_17470 [Cytophagales bacterium]|nr:hypothetical protein [Cytophagales bacterium]